MIKLFIKLVVALIVLLVIGLVVLYLSLDSIVKKTVEVEGTKQLSVQTTLDSVSLGLTKGTLDMKNFALGSPTGFTAPQMMSVGDLSVDTGGVSNLRGKPIHINTIAIAAPLLVVETKNEKVNFKEMMKNLPSNPDAKPAGSDGSTSSDTKLVINNLTVSGAKVHLIISALGKTIDKTVPLEDFTLQNIGNADGKNSGASIKDVVTAVVYKMANDGIAKSGVPIDVQDLLSGNLDSVKDKLTGAAQAQITKFVPANVGNAVNGLLNKTDANGQKIDPAKALDDAKNGLLKGLGK